MAAARLDPALCARVGSGRPRLYLLPLLQGLDLSQHPREPRLGGDRRRNRTGAIRHGAAARGEHCGPFDGGAGRCPVPVRDPAQQARSLRGRSGPCGDDRPSGRTRGAGAHQDDRSGDRSGADRRLDARADAGTRVAHRRRGADPARGVADPAQARGGRRARSAPGARRQRRRLGRVRGSGRAAAALSPARAAKRSARPNLRAPPPRPRATPPPSAARWVDCSTSSNICRSRS